MKAISLWQPWASLIATSAKRFETRSWSTKYRGPLVICAAKGGLSQAELTVCLSLLVFQAGLAPLVGKPLDLYSRTDSGVKKEHLAFGKALVIVDLVDCIRTDDMTESHIGTDYLFGDFSSGRYAWRLEKRRVFIEPFSIKGRQGLFSIDDALLADRITTRFYL